MAERKLVALSFDDGPTLEITDKVLDVLEENNVVASFFLIGQNITEQTEYLVKRAYNMGCTIENHSKTHPSMIDLTKQEILDEVNYTTERIEQVIGEKPQFFRPPYINYNQTMYDLIDLYFISGYGCATVKELVERILQAAKPGIMILMHDMVDNLQTVEAIKILIPELKKQGYEFVTIRDIFKMSGTKPQKNVIYMGIDDGRRNYE